MKKVFVVGGGINVSLAFRNAGFQIVDTPEEADVVCFTGGEDVDPALYGEENVHSYINKGRDAEEIKIFDAVKEKGTVMVGICRGGQ
ncbi:MAG: gamma-glutamyl-gamma-aminobutyrate hydrolase family protein, partial [Lactococcus garvieae]